MTKWKAGIKRWIALVMAVVIVIALGAFSSDRFLHAADDAVDQPEQTEEQPAEEAPAEDTAVSEPEQVILPAQEEAPAEEQQSAEEPAASEAEPETAEPEAAEPEQETEQPAESAEAAAESTPAETLADNHHVDVKIQSVDAETKTATLAAVLYGYENVSSGITYRWEYSADGGSTWTTVEGADAETYTFTVTEENAGYSWHVVVEV